MRQDSNFRFTETPLEIGLREAAGMELSDRPIRSLRRTGNSSRTAEHYQFDARSLREGVLKRVRRIRPDSSRADYEATKPAFADAIRRSDATGEWHGMDHDLPLVSCEWREVGNLRVVAS